MNLVTRMVALDSLHEKHTADNMAESMKVLFKLLKLDTRRMLRISSDAAANQVRMCEVLDIDNALWPLGTQETAQHGADQDG